VSAPVPILVSLALLAAAVVAGAVLLNDRGPEGASSTQGATPTAASSASAASTPSESTPSAQAAAIPAGYALYEDPTGFAVAIPAGWEVDKQGGSTFAREPGGRRYLQVDQTREPKPDPAADWTAQETGVSRRLAGYQRIRIDPVDFRGWQGADWEFTWQAEGGQRRVLNRGFITAADRAYALYWSVPAEQWEASLADYEVFAATFQPAT